MNNKNKTKKKKIIIKNEVSEINIEETQLSFINACGIRKSKRIRNRNNNNKYKPLLINQFDENNVDNDDEDQNKNINTNKRKKRKVKESKIQSLTFSDGKNNNSVFDNNSKLNKQQQEPNVMDDDKISLLKVHSINILKKISSPTYLKLWTETYQPRSSKDFLFFDHHRLSPPLTTTIVETFKQWLSMWNDNFNTSIRTDFNEG